VAVKLELMQHIKAVHATFLSTQDCRCRLFLGNATEGRSGCRLHRDSLSKDRVIGDSSSAAARLVNFSPADMNLLIAVGSQISSAIERSILYEETRQAYENLRRTQEQLLHSESSRRWTAHLGGGARTK